MAVRRNLSEGGDTMLRSALLSYLIGSFPNGYLFGRWFGGKDVRRIGSKNVGATNVVVNVGWIPGVLTLVGDMAKGYLAALVGGLSSGSIMPSLAPAFAIAGHNWPVWLGFHGGGGLATFVGACLRLNGWPMAVLALATWGAAYLLIRDHDKSAVVACVLLPCAVVALEQSIETIAFIGGSSLAVLLRRIQSIKEKIARARECGQLVRTHGKDVQDGEDGTEI